MKHVVTTFLILFALLLPSISMGQVGDRVIVKRKSEFAVTHGAEDYRLQNLFLAQLVDSYMRYRDSMVAAQMQVPWQVVIAHSKLIESTDGLKGNTTTLSLGNDSVSLISQGNLFVLSAHIRVSKHGLVVLSTEFNYPKGFFFDESSFHSYVEYGVRSGLDWWHSSNTSPKDIDTEPLPFWVSEISSITYLASFLKKESGLGLPIPGMTETELFAIWGSPKSANPLPSKDDVGISPRTYKMLYTFDVSGLQFMVEVDERILVSEVTDMDAPRRKEMEDQFLRAKSEKSKRK